MLPSDMASKGTLSDLPPQKIGRHWVCSSGLLGFLDVGQSAVVTKALLLNTAYTQSNL